MSGAGKSTVLNALEDEGWEAVDNLPQAMIDALVAGAGGRPVAVAVDARTRGFDAAALVARVEAAAPASELLYLDCAGDELVRRYDHTRRAHPLALDRPAEDGIARDRHLTAPLRARADRVIDTSDLAPAELAEEVRRLYAPASDGPVLTITSFGFARGIARTADMVFDMRFIANPHWDETLRAQTGLDEAVAAFVAADPGYAPAIDRIEALVADLLPRHAAAGKHYVTIAFGCTGGRHRSVAAAEDFAQRLRARGFAPLVRHRDLALGPRTPRD